MAIASAAMLPPAPGLASTMIGWPSFFDSPSAMMRDSVSAAPPRGKAVQQADRSRRVIIRRRRPGSETTTEQKNGRSEPLHPTHGCILPLIVMSLAATRTALFRSN
ncbi:hypothetical protein ACVOMS_01155 [Bradyrhizobium guangxiense]